MELMIPLKSRSEIPMYQQIYFYLKEEIKNGSLKAEARLPSTRTLAEHLKVSRSTTQMAYEQLLSEGYIEAVPCKGYYVAVTDGLVEVGGFFHGGNAADSAPQTPFFPGQKSAQESSFGERGYGHGTDVFGEDSRKAWPDMEVDFSPRGIDLNNFPFNAWRKITRNTLVDDNKEMFAAGNPQGEPQLREAVREYLHSARGVNCGAEQIIVGAGSEYLFMLLHQILGGNRKIAMENPTYKQAYRVLKSLGNQVIPVDMDKSGMDGRLLALSGADTAYVMPSHQYPMGIVMPVKRRQELLAWAAAGPGRYVIEDDYDSEFRYKGKPIPALQGIDSSGRVIYIGTFSKSVAPAIRVSFMVLPEELMGAYREKCYFYASTVSRIDQNILYQFITDGYYERHLNRMRAVYKAKHDALLSGLKPLEPLFSIQGENAGLHLLLTHKNGIPERDLVEKAKKAGARVYGLSTYFIGERGGAGKGPVNPGQPGPGERSPSSTVILGYANLTEGQIQRGTKLLRAAWIEGNA